MTRDGAGECDVGVLELDTVIMYPVTSVNMLTKVTPPFPMNRILFVWPYCVEVVRVCYI